MIDAVLFWLRGFADEPLRMLAVVAAGATWLVALVFIVRRASANTMRALLVLSASAYLLAFLAFIQPPPLTLAIGTASLITEGASGDRLASIDPATDVYIMDGAWREAAVAELIARRQQSANAGRTLRVASVDDVLRDNPDLARLRVMGFGVDAGTWFASEFRGAIDFEPPDAGPGLLDASYPQSLPIGRRLSVDVVTAVSAVANYRLVLTNDSGEELARAPLADAGLTRLGADALSPGRHLLQLSLRDADTDAVVERVPVPVQVVRPPVARIVMLQAAPSFEWRALSRWAADTGALVASRIAISDDRFRQRVATGMAIDPARLDPSSLAGVDLVIADGAALAALDEAQRDALLDPSHGAGLLVLIHDAGDFAGLPAPLTDVLAPAGEREHIYRIEGMGGEIATGLTRQALTFDAKAVTPLLEDDQRETVVARLSSLPHVAVSLLRDSYRLSGAGLGKLHARIWSRLVADLARPVADTAPDFHPATSRVGERLGVCLPGSAGADRIEVREADGARYALALHAGRWRPGQRCGWLWPASTGWLQVVGESGSAGAAHYIGEPGSWQQRRNHERISATQTRASVGDTGVNGGASRSSSMPRDWPLIVLLLLALLTWLSQRFAIADQVR